MKLFIVLCISLFIAGLGGMAQQKINPEEIKGKMQWFADAKLGIFIHSGIYAVDGVDESWGFYNKKIGYADYMKQLKGFTLKNYNPAAIFNTVAGIPQGHFYGPTTLSKDSTELYLFLHGKTSGKISWNPVPGLIYMDVPETVLDKYVTVIKLQFDKPLKLYRGRGGLS